MHIVDLDGAKTGISENRELVLEVVRRSSCPVQAGGGLRTMDDVEEVLAAGANRAVLGTVALEDPDALAKACERFGPRIIVSLDARGDELASHGWTVGTGTPVLEAIKTFGDAGVAGFIYTDIGRDGTMAGPNVDALLRVASDTDLPVIASGGIGSLDELKTVAHLHRDGIAGAIVGRALYERKFVVGEANLAIDEIVSGKVQEIGDVPEADYE